MRRFARKEFENAHTIRSLATVFCVGHACIELRQFLTRDAIFRRPHPQLPLQKKIDEDEWESDEEIPDEELDLLARVAGMDPRPPGHRRSTMPGRTQDTPGEELDLLARVAGMDPRYQVHERFPRPAQSVQLYAQACRLPRIVPAFLRCHLVSFCAATSSPALAASCKSQPWQP